MGNLGGRWCSSDRPAALKTLELQKVHNVTASKALGFLVARPRMGTFMRWPQIRKAIQKIVENQPGAVCLADLSSYHQETLCAEFLRCSLAVKFHLPQVESLLLPIGRTLRDIDIYGLQSCGRRVLAQVTFLPFTESKRKLNALNRFREDGDVDLIFFCLSTAAREHDRVKIVPLEQVFNSFTETSAGQRWIQKLFI
jgi:hypothetical protein